MSARAPCQPLVGRGRAKQCCPNFSTGCHCGPAPAGVAGSGGSIGPTGDTGATGPDGPPGVTGTPDFPYAFLQLYEGEEIVQPGHSIIYDNAMTSGTRVHHNTTVHIRTTGLYYVAYYLAVTGPAVQLAPYVDGVVQPYTSSAKNIPQYQNVGMELLSLSARSTISLGNIPDVSAIEADSTVVSMDAVYIGRLVVVQVGST